MSGLWLKALLLSPVRSACPGPWGPSTKGQQKSSGANCTRGQAMTVHQWAPSLGQCWKLGSAAPLGLVSFSIQCPPARPCGTGQSCSSRPYPVMEPSSALPVCTLGLSEPVNPTPLLDHLSSCATHEVSFALGSSFCGHPPDSPASLLSSMPPSCPSQAPMPAASSA